MPGAPFVKSVDLRALFIEMACLQHPLLDLVREKHGFLDGPKEWEREAWARAERRRPERNWAIVWDAIQAGGRGSGVE